MNSPDMFIKKPQSHIFYSPTSGYIKSIREDERYIHISLFLNIFDNHTQYIPVDSVLTNIKYYNGSFVPAYQEHSVNNERVENSLYNTQYNFSYTITQITGILTRRIISLQKVNAVLKPGERLGFIMLGSRVDIKIPKKNVENVLVKSNTHIEAMTPMFTLK
jgi:phosphatidylserine decarboxylase